jgi:hypothetical protein
MTMHQQQQQQKEEVQARAAICGDGGKELYDRSNGRMTTTTTTKPCFVCKLILFLDEKYHRLHFEQFHLLISQYYSR